MNINKTENIVNEWVNTYSDSLYSWALHKTSDKETAEDLVQETFLAAIKSLEKFNADSSAKTWLFSILNNKINDFYRKKYKTPINNDDYIFNIMFDEVDHWRVEQMPKSWPNEEEHLLDNLDFNQVLQLCLKKLPPNWNAAMHLKFIEDKKGNEICQDLGISDTNFWQILHRSKLQLRKCLELNWFKI